MKIGKALVNYCLGVSEPSWIFRIPPVSNGAVIYPWNFIFSVKIPYFLIVSADFSVYKKNYCSITYHNFLFVLKRSYICYYIICMTVPLSNENCLIYLDGQGRNYTESRSSCFFPPKVSLRKCFYVSNYGNCSSNLYWYENLKLINLSPALAQEFATSSYGVSLYYHTDNVFIPICAYFDISISHLMGHLNL